MVDRELWDRVQRTLAQCAEVDAIRGAQIATYPLRGCIRCHKCKRGDGVTPLTFQGYRANTNSKRPGYKLRRYRCVECCISLDANRIEKKALETLRTAMLPEHVEAQERARAEKVLRETGDLTQAVARVQEVLRQCDASESREAQLLAEAGISPHIIRPRIEKIQQERRKALAELQDLEQQAVKVRDPQAIGKRAAAQARERLAQLEAVKDDPAELQRLFRRHVRVTCWPKGRTAVDVSFEW